MKKQEHPIGRDMALKKNHENPSIGVVDDEGKVNNPPADQDQFHDHEKEHSAGKARRIFENISGSFIASWRRQRPVQRARQNKGVIRTTGRVINVALALNPIVRIFGSLIGKPIYSSIGKLLAYREIYRYFKERQKTHSPISEEITKDNVLQLNPQNKKETNERQERIKEGTPWLAKLAIKYRQFKSKRMTRRQFLVPAITSEVFVTVYSAWGLYSAQDGDLMSTISLGPFIVGIIVMPILIFLQLASIPQEGGKKRSGVALTK